MADKPYTEDDYKKMEAALAERARKQMQEQVAQEAAYMKPLRDFIDTAAYREVLAALPAIMKTYRDDDRFKAFLDCLMTGMHALTNAVGPVAATPVGLPAPAPAPEGNTDGE